MAVDQEARFSVMEVKALIEQHVAVCLSENKANDEFRKDVKKFIQTLQETFATAAADLKIALDTHAASDAAMFAKMTSSKHSLVIKWEDRFVGGLVSVCGFLFAKLMHWI